MAFRAPRRIFYFLCIFSSAHFFVCCGVVGGKGLFLGVSGVWCVVFYFFCGVFGFWGGFLCYGGWTLFVFALEGVVVDWKSAAVERGRLAEIAKIDREIYRLYHVVTDLWARRELIELSLRGDV